MLTNIELPTFDKNAPVKMINKKDRSFHMDRGKIVCNGCGGHFPNLVLFENHTHHDTERNKEANKPSKKSGPKNIHKTFNNISHEEMMNDFHKMPELAGCYYQDELFNCCMCGKGFANPYILFSHKIIHPADMKATYPRPPVPEKPRPRKLSYYGSQADKVKVVIPDVYSQDDVDNEMESDEDSCRLPSVTKAVVLKKEDEEDEALPITFGESRQMVQVPWVPFEKLGSSKSAETKGSRTYVYRMLGHKSELYTSMDVSKDPSRFVMVSPKETNTASKSTDSEGKVEQRVTNPGTEKGLVFTDLDDEKMKKLFNTLPGLQNCKLTEDGKYLCDKCSKKQDNPYLLFTHRLSHREVLEEQAIKSMAKDSTPQQTKLVFYSLPGLNKCKVINGYYHCDICQQKFSNPYLLFTHKMSHDSSDINAAKEPVIKLKENSDFGTIFGQDALANIKVKNGKYYCDRCSFFYTSPYLLLNHKLLHERLDAKRKGKLPVATVSSGQQTDDLDSSSEASSINGEGEPQEEKEEDICYECNICKLQYETLDGLSLHIESHVNSEERAEDDDDDCNDDDEDGDQDKGDNDYDDKSNDSVSRLRLKREAPETSDEENAGPSLSKIIKTEPAELYPGEVTADQSGHYGRENSGEVTPKETDHVPKPQKIKIKINFLSPKERVILENVKVKKEIEDDSDQPIQQPDWSMIYNDKKLYCSVVRLSRMNISPNEVWVVR